MSDNPLKAKWRCANGHVSNSPAKPERCPMCGSTDVTSLVRG